MTETKTPTTIEEINDSTKRRKHSFTFLESILVSIIFVLLILIILLIVVIRKPFSTTYVSPSSSSYSSSPKVDSQTKLFSHISNRTDKYIHSDDGIGQLLQLQIIFRHGDRSPIMPIKGDPYENYSWVEGFGQLTDQGKERMYTYGEVLRRKYEHFLGKCFWLE